MSAAPHPVAPADRRGALRHPVRVAGQLVSAGAAEVSVQITDISEQGCQVERSVELAPGTLIALSVGGFAPVTATVVWTSPRAFGLHFDHRLHPALVERVVAIGQGRRRMRRLLTPALVRRQDRERLWHVSMDVRLDGGAGHAIGGELSDVSVDGCRVLSPVAVLPGCVLAVEIAGEPPIPATVRWCADGAIGLQFSRQLDPATVERIARR